MIGANIVNLITAGILGIFAAAIRFGKASWLVAGYNTSSKAEKEKYDEIAMCRFVGNLMFTLAGISLAMAAIGFLDIVNFGLLMGIGWTAFVFVTIAAVIYMNTGQRFMKK